MLEIFRTYFNYCEVGEDGMTPAMRMGLARGPVASEDILYFLRRKRRGRCTWGCSRCGLIGQPDGAVNRKRKAGVLPGSHA